MSPEERELLQKTAELTKENNHILHSIKRSMRFSRIISLVYWVFIIGSAVGAYYIIQPYLDQVSELYGGAKSTFSAGTNFSSLLDSFR